MTTMRQGELTIEQLSEIETRCRVCQAASLTSSIQRVEREAHAMHVALREIRSAMAGGVEIAEAKARVDALVEAADEVHREARWQEELRRRDLGLTDEPNATRSHFIERLRTVECVLREWASNVAASPSPVAGQDQPNTESKEPK